MGETGRMEINIPANEPLLTYLASRKPRAPLIASPESAPDPYYGLGSHPDIVARVWDELSVHLPREARCIIVGTPGLIHVQSGVVLGLAWGTRYTIRLPLSRLAEAEAAGLTARVRWSTGDETNARDEFGPNWLFGAWEAVELVWLTETYEAWHPP